MEFAIIESFVPEDYRLPWGEYDEKISVDGEKFLSTFGVENEDYYCFTNSFKHEKVTLDKYTIIDKSRMRVVYNWLQHFSKESLSDEFEEKGFKVEALYSDVAGSDYDSDSSEIAIVAKKAI